MSMKVDLNQYQALAGRTARADWPDAKTRRMIATLGLCGESGEFADLVKKIHGHGHPFEEDQLRKELGDVLWYVAEVCTAFGWDLGAIAYQNLCKLRSRYPDGFDAARSLNRAEQHTTFIEEMDKKSGSD